MRVEFEINEETREYLKRLQGPIGVISVAGMYRSGKSYLLNRVLLNQSRGFDVGHTINACTKVSSIIHVFATVREVGSIIVTANKLVHYDERLRIVFIS